MITSNRTISEIVDYNPDKCNLLKNHKWSNFLRLCIRKNYIRFDLPTEVEGMIGSYLDVGNKEYYFNLMKIHKELDSGWKNSNEGNEFLLKYTINNIINYTKNIPINFSNEIIILNELVKKNRRKYLEKNIMLNLISAKRYANEGDEDNLKYTLNRAVDYANDINININVQVKELYILVKENLQTYYSNKIKNDLIQAKKYALEGNFDMLKYTLRQLSYFSEKINIDISDHVKENNILVEKNKKDFIKKKIKEELLNVRRYALDGNRFLVDYIIPSISEYAKLIDTDIDNEIKKINTILRES